LDSFIVVAGSLAGSGVQKMDEKKDDDTIGEAVAKAQTLIQSDKI
jgi:hypothetical protein